MPDISYGFIGLGNMGAPMCANLCAAGIVPCVFDAAGTAERAPAGTIVADDVAAVAQQDTVFLSLPDGRIVASVCDEILNAPGRTVSTVVDFSTTGPQAAGEIGAALAAGGITFVDAPVSGGRAGAIAGSVTVIASGPDEAVAALSAPFEAVGGNVFHVGVNPGQGQAVKLLNNFLSATAMAATSEAVQFGLGHGVAMETILDVVNVSTGQNTASADKFPKRVATESFDAGFAMALMTKDVALYFDEVQKSGSSNKVGTTMTGLWNAADGAMPGADFTEIYKYLRGDSDGETT
ncbi:MAG: NAD(P)-dependent oxidoreductase [Rhodospirillaceae bacterium]|jgi:3-hydroxyisobutyrate dehydrogenase|nr:NAD(P)-dependent oxidoreductase [Rhodospirillaceae bacterium]MBT5359673.1 NAD(P)-dependent oxidoreductase [Rhodospirillaceae bacterium]MBT5769901.1 NAD(P)-dependent oxidoreductase [Rhodospirillaceae bacterium]MBT6309835.1 NAD(P)-dependent oxidoreductase [Rhodospirillaceae bacterium]MBT7364152.1 NAD(P)-dependent oxidoreductase [Rhodospirillaceae bacterium]